MLDQALFVNNTSCGIIAQNLKSVGKIFARLKGTYERLKNDPDLGYLIKDIEDVAYNKNELVFSNGSSFYVDVSFRWDTLQFLHVSEFGKICAKYPDKAEEIVTWALEAVAIGNYVFIESTAEWATGYFYDYYETAKRLQDEQKKLNEQEFKLFFFAWWENKEYVINDPYITLTVENINYFKTLQDEYGIMLTHEQKCWYQIKKDKLKDKIYREYPSYPDEAFVLATEWAYYGKWITQVYKERRITKVPYDPAFPVHVSWDIWGAGWGDDCVLWFFQIVWLQIRFIDYWSGTGYSMLEVIAEVINRKEYYWWYHILPHDGSHHEQTTGTKRADALRKVWCKVIELAIHSISSRIDTTRDLFKFMFFDKEKTNEGFKKLSWYRRKYDKVNGWLRDTPEHDENSHTADSFWYGMMAKTLWFLSQRQSLQDAPRAVEANLNDMF